VRVTWFLISCAVLALSGNAPAQPASICDTVLIPTVEQAQSEYQRMQAFMYNNAENEYDRLHNLDASARAAAASYKFFSAEYKDSQTREQFRERVQQRLTTEGFNMSEEEARSHYRTGISERQGEQWLTCIIQITGRGEILLSPDNIDQGGFDLKVMRSFPTGVPATATAEIKVAGGTIDGISHVSDQYDGSGAKTYQVSAAPSSNKIKVIANMLGFTDSLSVDLASLRGTFKRVALSDIPEIGAGDIREGLQKNRVYWQREVKVAGGRYDKALGMHLESGKVGWVEYRIPIGATWLRGYAGLAKQDGNDCRGHFNFRVLLNNQPLRTREFKGDWMVVPEQIDIPVTGGQILRFEVDDGGDGMNCDHATVVNSYFDAGT